VPAGRGTPSRSPFFKGEGGEWACDNEYRGKIVIAAVSAGVTFPGGGGGGGGTQYAEGTTASTFTGTIALGEAPGDTAIPLQLNSTYHLKVQIASDAVGIGGGTQYAEGTTASTFTGSIALGEAPGETAIPLQLNSTHDLKVAEQNPLTQITINNTTSSAVPVNLAGTNTITVNNTTLGINLKNLNGVTVNTTNPLPVAEQSPLSEITINNTTSAAVPFNLVGTNTITINNTTVGIDLKNVNGVTVNTTNPVPVQLHDSQRYSPHFKRQGEVFAIGYYGIPAIWHNLTDDKYIVPGCNTLGHVLIDPDTHTFSVNLTGNNNITVNNTTLGINLKNLGGVAINSTNPIPVDIENTPLGMSFVQTATFAYTELTTTSSGTETIISAPGSTTAIQIRGFSIYNETPWARQFELRYGTTALWRGGLAPKAYQNWNMIGHYYEAPNNKAIIGYIDDAGTAVWTVFYKAV